MAMRKVLHFIALCHIISVTKTSFIQLNNGSYEDIVIAIHSGIQENIEIIDKIKEMVIDASSYLFHATENRLTIKSVKILIPITWTSKNYTKRERETYEEADIIITHPFLKYGDDPYTIQYRGCGEQGKYIHLTPNFLLNTSLASVYGSPGRIFVHEWAHLRWGVFDEYNTDKPYYVSRDRTVEATRCSVDLNGTNIIQECEGDSCLVRLCKIDSNTGLYEQGCLFLPDEDQHVQESIMYSQALPSVTAFCNESNHNTDAPNLQNRMCNLRSTWDIIMNSTDMKSTPPRPATNAPVPTFTLLQYKKRVITLACDVSGSMAHFDRIGRFLQAAEFFLTHIIEEGSYVGIVEFYTFAYAISKQLIQITSDKDRAMLISYLPTTVVNDGSNICNGILEALKVNTFLDGSSAGTEVILVTDGEDNLKECFGSISESGAIIHVIALGSEASEDLGEIADMTGGQKHFASDKVDANDLIDAFSEISNGNGDVTQQPIQLESRSLNLEPEQCMNGTIFIDSTIGSYTFFLVTWQVSVPSVNLQDPEGKIYIEKQFTNNTLSRSSRLQIPGKAESGAWHYNLCNNLKEDQVVGIIVTSKAVDESVPPITVNVHMNQDTNSYPNPMVVYASVHQGLLPVTGVKVTAFIAVESGKSVSLELLDNGAGADITINDGVYSKYFTSFTENGRYTLKVHIEGGDTESRLATPINRAHYIPGYIRNGTISMNPPRPVVNSDDLHVTLGKIRRIISGGFFTVNNVPTSPQRINYHPGKITDLEAKAQGNSIVLSWTATGDDLDQGTVSRYDLRMNISPKDLRDNFRNSASVNISNITPQPAGSREIFTFVPEDVDKENGTVFYFALTAIDKDNQESHISNIAQGVLSTSTIPESTSAIAPTTTGSTSLQTHNSTPTAEDTITLVDSTSSSANSMLPPTGVSDISTVSTNPPTDSPLHSTDTSLSQMNNSSTPHDRSSTPTDNMQPSTSNTGPPVVNTTSFTSIPIPSTEILRPTGDTLPSTGTMLLPTNNTFTLLETKYTILTDSLVTNNNTQLISSTIQQVTEITLLPNNITTSSAPETRTTASSSPGNINKTAVIVVVCVAAVLICVIIYITVYCVKRKRRGYYFTA
ncbi:calcium-activated chloride channel regulator 1-like [Pseudophryne corroboree]|uniref:calcium-activated chloride channel regulator 1-like n=1 Tax=Pseudophryne corroboree TaxID=495146 RepID=UPI003081EF7D